MSVAVRMTSWPNPDEVEYPSRIVIERPVEGEWIKWNDLLLEVKKVIHDPHPRYRIDQSDPQVIIHVSPVLDEVARVWWPR